jgi:hypothetical protein
MRLSTSGGCGSPTFLIPNFLIRLIAICLGLLPLLLLALAARLDPNPAGLGTHQQLGLPPCTMRVLAGLRCPGCGVTTAWCHFAKGQWIRSASVHIGGFLLALYSLVLAGVCLRSGWRGRLPREDTLRMLSIGLLSIMAVSLCTWLWKLAESPLAASQPVW